MTTTQAMLSKHTPGDWLADDKCVYALNITGVNRFSTGIQGGYTDTGRTSEEELQANARLIAAAPELLEAAVTAQSSLNAFFAGLPIRLLNEDEKGRSLVRAKDALSEAIAKAKGIAA